MLDTWIPTVRVAFRQIVRHPGPSLILVATLVVALGADTAQMALIDGLIL